MKHGPHSDYLVVLYNLKGQFVASFVSAKECALSINSHIRSVDKCLRNEGSTLHGYQIRWMKKKQFTCESIPPYEKKEISYKEKRVAKIDDNGVVITTYPSIKLAAKVNNTSPKSIREVLKGNQKRAGGYRYKLV